MNNIYLYFIIGFLHSVNIYLFQKKEKSKPNYRE